MIAVNEGAPVALGLLDAALAREWGSLYFRVDDYDRDGLNDLAVLQSVDRPGQQRCYAVFRYDPASGRFRNRKSFDRCGI
ncbi:MAG: hypothetical protein R3E89_00395 [Thiolinea sp.]